MEVLSHDECERRLSGGGVGVLALGGEGAPLVRPVNFTYEGERIWIRTGEGQLLGAARAAVAASFVLTSTDRFEHTGWSVIATGVLGEADEVAESLRLRAWVPSDKKHVITLSVDHVSGRRVVREAR